MVATIQMSRRPGLLHLWKEQQEVGILALKTPTSQTYLMPWSNKALTRPPKTAEVIAFTLLETAME